MLASFNETARQASEAEWQILMRAAQDGDRRAYARLLLELLPVLRCVVASKWRNNQDVEDIVQDIVLSVHAVRHTYDPSRPFMPWLMAIASRRIADTARKRASRASEILVDTIPETFYGAATKMGQEHSEDHDALQKAIAALPDVQREAIYLIKLKEMSLQEASALSGKSIVSLKVSVHRALRTMRTYLERKP
jgi:RNA polymerase sigma-70 factor (ECF subfamily)